jgi:REP element-mobilizing transposase RayT
LKGYDYSQEGAYFITICTQDRVCLFGDIVDGKMRLNDKGQHVEKCWHEILVHFPNVELDEFVIMPNHVHGILVIDDIVGAKNFSPLQLMPSRSNPVPAQTPRGTSKTIGSIIRGFKIGVTKWFRQNTPVYTVWQRNYYEHIIRNEETLHCSREYVINNPAQWELDRENPNFYVRAKNFSPVPEDEPWLILPNP